MLRERQAQLRAVQRVVLRRHCDAQPLSLSGRQRAARDDSRNAESPSAKARIVSTQSCRRNAGAGPLGMHSQANKDSSKWNN